MKTYFFFFSVILVFAIGSVNAQDSTQVDAAKTWCKTLANQQSGSLIPIFPPSTDLKPGSIYQLKVKAGSSGDFKKCVNFSQRVGGTVAETSNRVLLASFNGTTDRGGTVKIGLSQIPNVPLDIAANAGTTLKDKLTAKFAGTTRESSNVDFSAFEVWDKGIKKFANAKYDITKYQNENNPLNRRKFNLFFLVVDSVYFAKGIEYDLNVNRTTDAGLTATVNALKASGSASYNMVNGSTISMIKDFDAPIAIGVTGKLYEVDSRDGRIIASRLVP